MMITVIGMDLPGRSWYGPDGRVLADVHVGVQVRDQPTDLVPGDAARARWDLDIAVVDGDGRLDFRGPAVHGRRGERFVYLTWGDVGEDGAFVMFRRAKLVLSRIDPELVRTALAADAGLRATVHLTDDRGGPRCARVDPPAIAWSLG